MRAHLHFFNKVLLPLSVEAKELNRVLAIFTVEDFYILDLQRKYVMVVKELNGSLSNAQSMKQTMFMAFISVVNCDEDISIAMSW